MLMKVEKRREEERREEERREEKGKKRLIPCCSPPSCQERLAVHTRGFHSVISLYQRPSVSVSACQRAIFLSLPGLMMER